MLELVLQTALCLFHSCVQSCLHTNSRHAPLASAHVLTANTPIPPSGDVISALASEQPHIPYRNHKLTMLMSDSLGGNAKTLMFVNVSPSDSNLDESQNSLTYATRVRTIKNDARK